MLMIRNQQPSNIRSLIIPMLTAGMSYIFESRIDIESFQTANSSVVTMNLEAQLFREIDEWKKQILEMQKREKIIEKLNVLESVSGMLNELTTEQIETFEKSVKRRPFFK